MDEKIAITREEYKHLKTVEKEERELLKQLVKGLDDIKAGRVKPF